MPIYAYRCAECGHAYDRLQKLSDPDPEICPECGASALKRQLTAPSFRLSGSGWYETDFKKEGDKKRNLTEGGEGAAKAAAEGKSDSGSSDGGKSDSGKSDSGKSDSAKPDSGKSNGGKSDSAKSGDSKAAASPAPAAKADSGKSGGMPKPAAG